jgi:t-SNARE complex subunit (syntaxin)
MSANNFYKNQIYGNDQTRKEQSKDALAYVEDRHKQIVQISKDVKEVKDLFVEVSLLVNEQDGLITTIEQNVDNSANHVKTGVVEVKKASEYQKSSRKMMCCLGLILVIVLLIIVVTLIIVYAPHQ